jgi:hypothetical protein
MKSPGAPAHRREVEREFWREIATGLLPEQAAGVVGVSQAVGSRWFRHGGGMPSVDLAPLSGRYLSFREREEIAILKVQSTGVREIARQLGRAPSTISRELRRNAATRGGKLDYRASVAQWKADLVARRPKTAKLVANMSCTPQNRRDDQARASISPTRLDCHSRAPGEPDVAAGHAELASCSAAAPGAGEDWPDDLLRTGRPSCLDEEGLKTILQQAEKLRVAGPHLHPTLRIGLATAPTVPAAGRRSGSGWSVPDLVQLC